MKFSTNKITAAVIVHLEFIVLCLVSGSDLRVGDNFNNGFFVSEIFNKYGVNDFITYEGFEHLLENLGLGKLKFDSNHDVSMHRINGTFVEIHDELSLHKHNHESLKAETNVTETSPGNDENIQPERKKRNLTPGERDTVMSMRQKCLTPQDMLITFGLEPPHDLISPEKYLQICPAIIYELDQKLCQGEDHPSPSVQQEPKNYRLVWMYASLSIFIMGVSGMLCVLMVPLVGKDTKSPFLQFLISLAAGTLCGDALMHLLPQVFSNVERQNESELMPTYKGMTALLALFLFFFIEGLLKECKRQKKCMKKVDTMLPNDDVEEVHHPGHSHAINDINSVAWMAILGDILHNLTDGLSIGAAFTLRISAGFASSIAIFCHELPHELGDYAIFLASGMSLKKSLFYNVVSSIFSFFGMVTGILLGEFENASLWISSITAGSFLYVALTDLLPEMKIMARESGDGKSFIIQLFGFFCGGVLMLGIAVYEDEIEAILC